MLGDQGHVVPDDRNESLAIGLFKAVESPSGISEKTVLDNHSWTDTVELTTRSLRLLAEDIS